MNPLDLRRRQLLSVLHFFVGATALVGGGLLVVWADGRMLQLSMKALSHSPFTDFLLPGVMLYGAIGVSNLIACFLEAKGEKGAEVGLAG